LITLYNVEARFLDRLVRLDATIDALRDELGGVSAGDLNKQVKDLVEMADDLTKFGRENAFFGVFDRLVTEGSGGKALRNSALVLEITPARGKTVNKVLTAARPAAIPSELVTAGGSELAAGAGRAG
jgi:hypothetical protein